MAECDVLIAGTGSLAEAALFAMATADAGRPIRIAIGGRNADRCTWLTLAANARAAAFSLPNYTSPTPIPWDDVGGLETLVKSLRPRVIIQTASMQSPWALVHNNAWAALVREGGYGLGTPFHTILTARLARAVERAATPTTIINGAYPDVANAMIRSAGIPSPLGFGNIDIVAIAVAAQIGSRTPGDVRIIGQWEPHVADFREPQEKRRNINPRAWLNGKEVPDFMTRFQAIKFPPGSDDSLNQITGTTVVPMALALVSGRSYIGHAAGPFGYPGGYPVRIDSGNLALNLPDGITAKEAIAFNKKFEEMEGLHLDEAARHMRLIGKSRSAMQKYDPALADGYAVDSLEALEQAVSRLETLRTKLLKQPGF